MGPQQQITLQIEGVLHVPGRMVLGNVQSREVVVVLLHLGPFGHAVPEAEEQIDDLLGGGDQGVAVPHRDPRRRRRHINAFAGDAFRHRRLLHRRKTLSQQALHLGFEHIGPLTHQRSFTARQLAHGPEHPRDPSLFAQQTHPQLFEGRGIGGLGDFGCGLLLERIQLIGELLQGDRGAHGPVAKGS